MGLLVAVLTVPAVVAVERSLADAAQAGRGLRPEGVGLNPRD